MIDDRRALPQKMELTDNLIILKEIGRGGTGITYLCENTENGKKMIIKEVFPLFPGLNRGINGKICFDKNEEEFIRAFSREQIEHEIHISSELNKKLEEQKLAIMSVEILDIALKDEILGMIRLETHSGKTLEELAGGPLLLDQALKYIRGLLIGLTFFHTTALHLDLKPGNVFFFDEAPYTCRLLDYGTCRLKNEKDEFHGTSSYTRYYTAPDVEISDRTDLFSVGVILLRLLLGPERFYSQYDRVFNALASETGSAVIFSLLSNERECDAIIAEVAKFIAKSMAYDPEDRFHSSEEMLSEAELLLDIIQHNSIHPVLLKAYASLQMENWYIQNGLKKEDIRSEWIPQIELKKINER